MFTQPFLVACELRTWCWDYSAFPAPGHGFVLLGQSQRLQIRCVEYAELQKVGCTGVAGMDAFLQTVSENHFSTVDAVDFVVDPGDAVWLAPGWMPCLGLGFPGVAEERFRLRGRHCAATVRPVRRRSAPPARRNSDVGTCSAALGGVLGDAPNEVGAACDVLVRNWGSRGLAAGSVCKRTRV